MQSSIAARDSVKQRVQEVLAALRTSRPYATNIEVTAEEQAFAWKAPLGFGWSKTSDLKVAIVNTTKRLHLVISAGTSDLYFYK